MPCISRARFSRSAAHADNIWWTDKPFGHLKHPDFHAPRCAPCNFQRHLPEHMPKGCPCTPALLCESGHPGIHSYGKDVCGIPRCMLSGGACCLHASLHAPAIFAAYAAACHVPFVHAAAQTTSARHAAHAAVLHSFSTITHSLSTIKQQSIILRVE